MHVDKWGTCNVSRELGLPVLKHRLLRFGSSRLRVITRFAITLDFERPRGARVKHCCRVHGIRLLHDDWAGSDT
jgi:hypothetical protein